MFLFRIIVMLLTMFYLFRDGSKLVNFLKRHLASWRGLQRADEVRRLISVTLSSGFVVSAVQGFLGGLVFWFLGMPSPLFLGSDHCVSCILAHRRPWLVWIPAAIGSIINGDVANGIALAVLGLVLISGADNVLRPMLIAGRSELNGLLVFVRRACGISTFGLLGVVLGPLVMATAVGMLKGYQESVQEQRAAPPPVKRHSSSLTTRPYLSLMADRLEQRRRRRPLLDRDPDRARPQDPVPRQAERRERERLGSARDGAGERRGHAGRRRPGAGRRIWTTEIPF